MAEDNNIAPIKQDEVQVDQPSTVKGKVEFMTKAGRKNPAPIKVKAWTDGIAAFCSGSMALVGGTDLFTGYQAKIIALLLGLVGVACFAIQKGTGVRPLNDEEQ